MDQNVASLLIAVFSAGGGALVLRLADKFWRDAAKREDDETLFRKELREDGVALRAELNKSRQEYTALHEKFMKLNGDHLQLQLQHAALQAQNSRHEDQLRDLGAEVVRLKAAVEKLRSGWTE